MNKITILFIATLISLASSVIIFIFFGNINYIFFKFSAKLGL